MIELRSIQRDPELARRCPQVSLILVTFGPDVQNILQAAPLNFAACIYADLWPAARYALIGTPQRFPLTRSQCDTAAIC